ncbi:MAG: hypothetical protein PHE50_04400 [Dehalococcoidales bacterium]|nr:hypothetical protein [Dehalococcoidales bacterium]
MKNPYRTLGIGLAIGGGALVPIFYFFINSVPLTAVGLSSIILGFTSIALGNSRPYISPEAANIILKTGMENTSALLEEIGLNTKAIYVPSSNRDGKPQAIIPLIPEDAPLLTKGKINGRLIVRFGDSPDAMGIAVTTPGSINLNQLPAKLGNTPEDIEAAIMYVLVGLLDLAQSVRVHVSPSQVDVEIKGTRLSYEDIWYYRCLGSPVASIAATITCEALGKPVRIAKETVTGKTALISLEVVS